MSAAACLDGFIDTRLDARVLHVMPGDYRAIQAQDVPGQAVLATTLGSCVAACMYEEGARGIGGMNHFLLPGGADSTSARYGVHAMELLINALLKLGARRSLLRAKIFGGGAVLAAVTSMDIGRLNVGFVRQFLATEGIPITGEDVLGPHPRRVLFYPSTSEARVKRLPLRQAADVARSELRYQQKARSAPARDSVEIF